MLPERMILFSSTKILKVGGGVFLLGVDAGFSGAYLDIIDAYEYYEE
jgi:hypothetical protein